MKRSLAFLLVSTALLLLSTAAFALRFSLPPEGDDLFGKIQFARVNPGEDFSAIARRYDVGFYELVEANPEVDPDNPPPNTLLLVPTQYLLPHVARSGMIINLAAMRLYFFPKGKDYFYTYPIGIGRYNWSTPLGMLHIIQKIENPTWVVPKSIMQYRKEQGDPVPSVVGVGPDNPLGKFAMRLSKPTYLIHGTNDPSSVGRRSSAGCIHLYPEDIERLFEMIPVGMHVLIINQPYQVGMNDGNLYMQAHLPLEEDRAALANASVVVVALINSILPNDNDSRVNWQKANDIVKEHMGIPTLVGQLRPSSTERTSDMAQG